jgi:hypothetical protein
MKFGTDCHFNIGAEHISGGKPCQDYAMSGIHGVVAYAMVSDGCSSGGNTDVGARLIALSGAAAIREHQDVEGSAADIATAQAIEVRRRQVLKGIKETLQLASGDMLATEVYARITPKGGYVHVWGDGVVAFVYVGGGVTLHRFDWPNNTPYYPSYVDNLSDLSSFIAAHGGNVAAPVLCEQVCEYPPASGNDEPTVSTVFHSIADGVRGIHLPITVDDLSRLAFVVVFSDGVTRVDKVDWKDAARELLSFKAADGVFAKRRMINFVREVRKQGRGPLDDIAFAAISITHDSEEITDGTT